MALFKSIIFWGLNVQFLYTSHLPHLTKYNHRLVFETFFFFSSICLYISEVSSTCFKIPLVLTVEIVQRLRDVFPLGDGNVANAERPPLEVAEALEEVFAEVGGPGEIHHAGLAAVSETQLI